MSTLKNNSTSINRAKSALNGFSTRFKEASVALGGPYALGKKAGFSAGAIQKWVAGESEPGLLKVIALAEAAGVRFEWLATGEGPMREGENEELSVGSEDSIPIPFYDLQESAGHSQAIEEPLAPEKYMAFQTAWIKGEGRLNRNELLLATVVGDAMEPTLRQADVVLVDRGKAHVPDDGLYVLKVDGAMLVKRLRKRPGRKVQVISDNEVYGSFDLNLADLPEDMAVMGRVVWFCRGG